MPPGSRHACSAALDRMSDGAGPPCDRTSYRDRGYLCLLRQALMQRFCCRTLGWRAVCCLVKGVQLRFKLLVHEQQSFECAAHITVAAGGNAIAHDDVAIYNNGAY